MKKLSEAIQSANASTVDGQFAVLNALGSASKAENDFVVFLKPELLVGLDSKDSAWAVERVLSILQANHVTISLSVLYTGGCLKQKRIMDAHYRFINQVSRLGLEALNEKDSDTIKSLAGKDRTILGGHQVLEKYPHLTPASLREIWFGAGNKKVRSGLYYTFNSIEGQPVMLLNGFHPMQLEHFTHDQSKIVVMLCSSDLNWSSIKDHIIGDTYPEKAAPNSIREVLFREGAQHGISDIGVGKNCIHGSAGPFEAAWESENFFVRGGVLQDKTQIDSLPVQKLLSGLQPASLRKEQLFANPAINLQGKETDLFTCTENMNTSDAAKLLKELVQGGQIA